MNQYGLVNKLMTLLEDTNSGILTTIDKEGYPHPRWMTPAVLPGRKGAIFAVTSLYSEKVHELSEHPQASWVMQSPDYREVIQVYGKVNIIDNPSLKSEVLEQIGKKLTMFWKVHGDISDFVLLETVMEKAVYSVPLKGRTEIISFKK